MYIYICMYIQFVLFTNSIGLSCVSSPIQYITCTLLHTHAHTHVHTHANISYVS